MSRIWVLLMIMGAIIEAMALSGCVPKNAYQYEDIKTEYADLACPLDASRSTESAKGKCIIDKTLALKDILTIAKTNNPDLLMPWRALNGPRPC